MKAEDAERLWCLATAVNGSSLAPLPEQLADLVKFARACEQHGIGRAKAGAKIVRHVETVNTSHFYPDGIVDFSELYAEVAKENEDG